MKMKISINQTKSKLEGITSRLNQAEKCITEIEDKLKKYYTQTTIKKSNKQS
jgi:hypothetical protein